ncbi:MAG: hypothetical protein NZZ41_00205 [Candidatus Dojkabacteria bacterium]|nr:hypothetical protein [Candidatus Dojkabacteria bacterium]
MGRPLSDKFFGIFDRKVGPQVYLDSVWIPGEPAPSGSGYIISQSGTRKYIARSTNTGAEGVVRLVNSSLTESGQALLTVYPKLSTTGVGFSLLPGNTFWVNFAKVVNKGSNYSVGDVLTVSGGTFTTPATLTVTQVSSLGEIENFNLTTQGDYTVIPTNINDNPVTGGLGSGATFKLDFGVNSVSFSGGSGFPNGTSSFVAVVRQQNGKGFGTILMGDVSGGTVTTLYVASSGHGYTSDAPSSLEVVSFYSVGPQEFVKTLTAKKVKTFNNKTYIWNPLGLANYPNSCLLLTR